MLLADFNLDHNSFDWHVYKVFTLKVKEKANNDNFRSFERNKLHVLINNQGPLVCDVIVIASSER